jgi:hypothetical protein
MIFIGALVLIAVVLWGGYMRAWKNFGTTTGGRYIKNYVLSFTKDSVEARIYNLVKRNPNIYSLDPGTSFDNGDWITLRFADYPDSFACIFKFAGDSVRWKQDSSSTIELFSVAADGKAIHYLSAKNGDLHDTANLYRVFERMVLDSLRKKR